MTSMVLLARAVETFPHRLPTLQSGITGGGLGAIVVTFLVASVFYAVTLHLAATYFIGDVPSQKAAYVGPVPAVVSILLGAWGLEQVGFVSPGVGIVLVVAFTLIADGMAIARVYDLDTRPTVVLTLLHFAFAVILGVALNNLLGFV